MKISELPQDLKEKALDYQRNETYFGCNKKTDSLVRAFDWKGTKEGHSFWGELHNKQSTHYDNSNGSIYKFCEDQKLNSYEFDLIKRIVRCRKKGQFTEDLEKTKALIDLYLLEHEKKN